MAEKTVIYGNHAGEPLVPLTVRIEWLPDGSIRPLMYRTSGGLCCRVEHVYGITPLNFLKDKGAGLRYKVRAEVIQTPEDGDERLHSKNEACLYLTGSLFCGKNFIDKRYGHKGKEFIPVILDVFPDGGYELIYFVVKGARYIVEKRINAEPRGSFNAGGIGLCHHVEARQVNADNDEDPDPDRSLRRPAALFFEINKWFIAISAT